MLKKYRRPNKKTKIRVYLNNYAKPTSSVEIYLIKNSNLVEKIFLQATPFSILLIDSNLCNKLYFSLRTHLARIIVFLNDEEGGVLYVITSSHAECLLKVGCRVCSEIGKIFKIVCLQVHTSYFT